MHPILFSIGDTAIHTYGVAGAVGFLLVCGITLTRATWAGLSRDRIADVLFWASISGMVGARALFLYQNPGAAHSIGEALNLRTGGLVFYGALIVGIPASSLLLLKYKLPFFKTWDVFSTALPLGHAVARVGCLAAGCCYGRPTDVGWAVTYHDKLSNGPLGVPVHPTQAYEAVWLTLVFIVCNVVYARKRFDGQVTLVYLVLYAIGRSVIEEFRGDADRGFVFRSLLGDHLSVSQAISALVVVVAGIMFFALPKYLNKPSAPPQRG